MVVLVASICTRGGKAVLSRQFREMQRSRVEALLASFPKLVGAGNQHTTVEQDNVRYVYQPLDELYMVLITNRQSNILQDIDSLHLFAQVVSSICRSLDEREILRNAFELLSAFDELVNLGYRENLTLPQIKTFLEMESHEERVAMIIESNKQLEANEQRKLKAKQLEMQRRDQQRAGAARAANMPRTPNYPTYTPPAQPVVSENMDSYAAEKNRKTSAAPLGKGMQLGKKSRSTNMYDQVRGDLGPEEEVAPAPINPLAEALALARPTATSAPSALDGQEPIHVIFAETITARLSREGAVESMEVKGDLQLRITDPSLTQVKLSLTAPNREGVQFNTHPKVDRPLFNSTKVVQLREAGRGFPANQSIGVMRWRYQAPAGGAGATLPITFTCWVSEGSAGNWSITVEYELTGDDTLQDVIVAIPFAGSEPQVGSFDAQYEIAGDALEWHIGTVDESTPNGSFEFEVEADSDEGFFPMSVRFSKTKPFIDVDVDAVTLINEGEDVSFSKEVKSRAESYVIV